MSEDQESRDAVDPRFTLSRHAALKIRREGCILVLPERAIRVGGSGGEIMQLCDVGRTRGEILHAMKTRYPATPEITEEVDRFLDEMVELGGLVSTDTIAGTEAASR